MHIWAGSCENTNFGSFDWEMMRFLHRLTTQLATASNTMGLCWLTQGCHSQSAMFAVGFLCVGRWGQLLRWDHRTSCLNIQNPAVLKCIWSLFWTRPQFLPCENLQSGWIGISLPRKSELEKATVLLEEWLRTENKLYFRKKLRKTMFSDSVERMP